MNTKQIFENRVEIYVGMKRDLAALSSNRTALKMNRLQYILEDKEVPDEVLEDLAKADALVSVKIRQLTVASFYMAAAYGCEFISDGLEEEEAFIACAERIRTKLFTMLQTTSLFDLAIPSEGLTTEDMGFYSDIIDMGNIYSRYFEELVVTPKLD